jgi:O-antigen ligase
LNEAPLRSLIAPTSAPQIHAALLFLTSATAIDFWGVRLSDMAVGALAISVLLYRPQPTQEALAAAVLTFILLALVIISTAVPLISENPKGIGNRASNAFSIPLSITLAALMTLNCSARNAAKFSEKYCRIALISTWSIWIYTTLFGYPTGVTPWEDPTRFSAISDNPNQLALFVLPIPFFALLAYTYELISKSRMITYTIAALLMNAAIIGKGLFIAWMIALAVLTITGYESKVGRSPALSNIIIRGGVAVALFLLATPIIISLYTGETPGSQAQQGSIRLDLWRNGVSAWAEALFFGHGPGHYSGIDAPYNGMEAHNLFIDWATAYGLLGILALLGLFLFLFTVAATRKQWIVCALYLCLLTQSTFHFYARQPAFWIFLAAGFCVSTGQRKRSNLSPAGETKRNPCATTWH